MKRRFTSKSIWVETAKLLLNNSPLTFDQIRVKIDLDIVTEHELSIVLSSFIIRGLVDNDKDVYWVTEEGKKRMN